MGRELETVGMQPATLMKEMQKDEQVASNKPQAAVFELAVEIGFKGGTA